MYRSGYKRLRLHSEGNSSTSYTLKVFTNDFTPVKQRNWNITPKLDSSSSLTIDEQGNLFLLENNRQRFHKFDNDGGLLYTINKYIAGWPATVPDRIVSPHDIAVSGSGRIYALGRATGSNPPFLVGEFVPPETARQAAGRALDGKRRSTKPRRKPSKASQRHQHHRERTRRR